MAEHVPTSERLALALSLALAPKEMIERAEQGFYDDFKSPLAFPIMQLVNDAVAAGLVGIAQRAREGEFDSEKWESDEWAQTEEGQSIIREFTER